MTLKNIKMSLMLLCVTVTTALSTIASATQIDLLILYDTYSKNYFSGDPNTAMINWVNQINAAYAASQVDIQLRLVGVRLNDEVGADQGAVLGNLRVDSAVIALRDQLGADFVSQVHQTGSCGIGYVAVDKNWTWNVVSPGCGPMTMAHEMGHNMGLNHSRRQGDTTGTRYRYGVGYGVDSSFVTIMAYSQSFNNAPRQNLFSNPNLTCKGLPCGVPEGQDQEAYAAKAIHNVRDEMAAFRTSTTVTSGPVKVYQHCSYGGYSAGLTVGTYTLSQLVALGVKDNDLSSLEVPSGYKVTLYSDDNFAGTSVVLAGNDTCLVAKNFNDLTSSIRVTQDTIKIFQHCNYGGYSASLAVGTYTLAQLVALGVKDNDLSSIQVPSGYKATLYKDDNFTGTAVSLIDNDTCLVAKGFNDTVTSIRIEAVASPAKSI